MTHILTQGMLRFEQCKVGNDSVINNVTGSKQAVYSNDCMNTGAGGKFP